MRLLSIVDVVCCKTAAGGKSFNTAAALRIFYEWYGHNPIIAMAAGLVCVDLRERRAGMQARRCLDARESTRPLREAYPTRETAL